MKLNYPTLLTTLRDRRKALKLTQEYVATRMNCTKNMYCKLELGLTTLSLQQLDNLCEILEVDIAQVIIPSFNIPGGQKSKSA